MPTVARKSKANLRKPSKDGAPVDPVQAETRTVSSRGKTLLERPGFLVRRLYQIHVALFVEECANEAITPIQHSVLVALDELGTIDQTGLSRAIALDRTNVADVIKRLESRSLVRRSTSPNDQRMSLASLTPQGRALLKRVARASARAHARTVAALPKDERELFLDTLTRLIESGDSTT